MRSISSLLFIYSSKGLHALNRGRGCTETFDRLHFVAENGGQVVIYGKLQCQEFMASNDVEKLLRYFNYDLLDKPTIFNGAKSAYMLSGTKLYFGKEMIIEEEQAAMEASINV